MAQCRQALALGLDVSGSVDATEYALQMQGIALALEDAEVQSAFLSLPDAPVAFAVYEWSGPTYQRSILPWRHMRNASDLKAAAQVLFRQTRTDVPPTTGLGAAIEYGLDLLGGQAQCWRLTLDISGDGKNNSGPPPNAIRATHLFDRTTINGLAIGVDTPTRLSHEELEVGELVAYYRNNVLAGPGAFLETALGFSDFERAIKKKLLKELAFQTLSQLGQKSKFPL